MKKLALILMISLNLNSSPLTPKARAYFKIGYGFTSLLMGIGSPVMGGYHFIAGKVLAKVSKTVDKANDQIDQKVKRRPFLHLLAFLTKGPREGAELAIDSQVTLQNVSAGFYLTAPLFFIPLGVAAIRQGRKELKELKTDIPAHNSHANENSG